MSNMLYPIIVPIIAGAIVLFIPKGVKIAKEAISIAVSALTLFITIGLFTMKPLIWTMGRTALLNMDNMSGFVMLFVAIFGFLAVLYSLGFMKGKEGLNRYYGCLLMTIGGSIGAVLANDLILFLAFWGFLGALLYILINLGTPEAAQAGKKALIIIGGSDAVMILGVGIVWIVAKTFSMEAARVPLDNGLAILAFFALACGAFAKAGVMPLHTWIPSSSEPAPVPVMALIPASLDKLLGIYFLARISLGIFDIRSSVLISNVLMGIGAFTILAGVMMALVQHNFKKLLAYHAVSQVGYMVLGIGTGNPVGIAGALFHMLNNGIFKYGLFLSSGAVELKKKTTDLDKLGGLSKIMPITYITFLISALAISGVPPFNGFFSKWMVYQGVVNLGESGGRLWIIWLTAAIFGSALTLASFMKITHAVFLGQCARGKNKMDEVEASMWIPMVALAGMCVLFGIFAYRIPIKLFIQPSVAGRIVYSGAWNATLSTGLILAGVIMGAIIYAIGNMKKLRVDEPFIGGEEITEDMKVSGVAFYKSIEEMPFISRAYRWARKGYFDIYDQLSNVVFFFNRLLKALHNGVLPTYLAWCLAGAMALFWVLR